eukprot:SAG11_NODE_33511_length_277_cov_0.573034_1_plen_39_part_01
MLCECTKTPPPPPARARRLSRVFAKTLLLVPLVLQTATL